MEPATGFSFAGIIISLGWGIISFVSPCILPLIPSYVSYITGISYDELVDAQSRRKNIAVTLRHSIMFVLGFTIIFVMLGATASLVGQLMTQYLGTIRVAGGVLMVLLGLFVSDVIKLPFLQREAKLHLKNRPAGYIGTMLVGLVFGAGWTPCTGPFLGAALLQAAQAETMGTGMVLLTFYSLGIGIPFILSAIAISAFLSTFGRLKRHLNTIRTVSGGILVIMGLLLITDKLTLITSYSISLWEKLKSLW